MPDEDNRFYRPANNSVMSKTLTARDTSLNRRLFAEAFAAGRMLALSIGAHAALGVVIIVQALLLSQSIHRVFRLNQRLVDVTPLLLTLLLVIVLRAGLVYLGTAASAELAIRIKHELRGRFVAHLYALGPARIRAERSGDIALSVTDGIDKLDGYYRDYLPGLFNAVFLPLAILLVVLPLDLVTFVVLLVTAPLIPFFMALIGMAAGVLARQQFFQLRHLGAHFLDVMQGLTTLKLFNRSQHQIETIRRITGEFRSATMRVLRVAFLSALTLELLATLSVAIVAVEIGLRLLRGGIGFEHALFLLVIAPEFYLPLRALGAKFHNATEGKAVAERIFGLLDTPATASLVPATQPVPSSLHIRFESVSLAYERGDRPALSDISFSIAAGQIVALVGPSGSGKSTVANLLMRFLEPDSGRIMIGDYDLANIAVSAWREKIAWVPQSPYILNATVADNIRFSRPDATQLQIIAAAQAAGAHTFIAQLPTGYETICGERGLRFSGGQAQRIALARALLRDAPLLILDEPTSQLDSDSESIVLHALDSLPRPRSVLLITHRLLSAARADHIVVLQGGHLAEQGTHAALLASGGVYARLVAGEGDAPHAP